MKVLTVTINPALDKSSVVNSISPDKKLRCEMPLFQPGGGGVNVSRAMNFLGYESICSYSSGGPEGEIFDELLKNEGVKIAPVHIESRIRENLIVFETSSSRQYRFGMPGPHLTQTELEGFENQVNMLTEGDFFVLSGSLPEGVSPDYYVGLVRIAKSKGAKVIADTSGAALKAVVQEGVFLIKPNFKELKELVGGDSPLDTSDVLTQEILSKGQAKYIAVSKGGQGAVLFSSEGSFHAIPPVTEVRSTVGAGDSMVAGMLVAFMQEKSLEAVISSGVAAGTAATMQDGTSLCSSDNYEWVLERIKTSVIN
jgi:6-phosphofructokinase 2